MLNGILHKYRHTSRGFARDPIATVYPRILLGPGFVLTPMFIKTRQISHVINCAEDEACPLGLRNAFGSSRYVCMNALDRYGDVFYRAHQRTREGIVHLACETREDGLSDFTSRYASSQKAV